MYKKVTHRQIHKFANTECLAGTVDYNRFAHYDTRTYKMSKLMHGYHVIIKNAKHQASRPVYQR